MMVFGYVEGTSKLAKGNNLLVIPDREGIIVYKDGLYGVISSSGRTLLPIELKKVYRELVNGKSTYYMVYGDDNKTENILEFWNKTIGTVSNKDNTTVTNNNWMYMGLYEWTVSRSANYSDYVFLVYYDGLVNSDYAGGNRAVRATFSLLPSITYVSGSGSMSDPMRIN